MSSGESDPDMVEKQLKHDNESPKDLPKGIIIIYIHD
jgi:hypothetical protein